MIRNKYYKFSFMFPCIVYTQTGDNLGHAGVILESGQGRSKFKTTAFLKALMQNFEAPVVPVFKKIPVSNKPMIKNDGSWNKVPDMKKIKKQKRVAGYINR